MLLCLDIHFSECHSVKIELECLDVQETPSQHSMNIELKIL